MSRALPETYVEFHDGGRSLSGKTFIYEVRAKGGGSLGTVAWFGRWRCYSFFPAARTVFERKCLRDIADFCEREMAAHRAAKKG
jgi:hypothetical protein